MSVILLAHELSAFDCQPERMTTLTFVVCVSAADAVSCSIAQRSRSYASRLGLKLRAQSVSLVRLFWLYGCTDI